MPEPKTVVEQPGKSQFFELRIADKQAVKLITEFTFPKDLSKFDWKGDLSSAEDDFSKACSKEGVVFRIRKNEGTEKEPHFVPSEKLCLIKIRGFERGARAEEQDEGITKVEIISANMWIDNERACRMDMTLRYYSDGKVTGDRMTATSNLDKSDPMICEMDKATRYDENGNPDLNGFWSNRKLSYHAREGGKIEHAGRTFLSIITTFGRARGMSSFRMRTTTEHECDVARDFYEKLGSPPPRYLDAGSKQPYGLELSGLERLPQDMPIDVRENKEAWKPENVPSDGT